MSSPIFLLGLDAFRIIGEYLTARILGRLWLSGDKTLQSVLTRSSVVEHFHLEYGNTEKVSWPNLLSNFGHLLSLRLKIPSNHPLHEFPEINLAAIPSGLEHLQLSSPSCAALDGLFQLLTGELPLDLAAILPSLEILYLEETAAPSDDRILPKFEIRWPLQLRNLSLNFGASFPASMLESLPPTLQSLDIRLHLDGVVPPFPPALATLVVRGLPNEVVLPALPPTMTDLYIVNHIVTSEGTEALRFPPALTSLLISMHLSVETASALPRSLTELKHLSLSLTDLSAIAALPRSLRVWTTPRVPAIAKTPEAIMRVLESLPPALEDIPVLFYNRVDLATRPSLPPALTTLYAVASDSEAITECIPAGILELNLRSLPVRHIATLPRRMRSFTGSLMLSDSPDIPDPLKLFGAYPLVTLNISSIPHQVLHGLDFHALPPTLTRLKLLIGCDVNQINWSLPWCHSLTDMGIAATVPLADQAEWFAGIPQKIKSMAFTASSRIALDPSLTFPHLPGGLTRLRLSNLADLFDDHLEMLPRKLQNLQLLTLRASYITTAGLSRLPPDLSNLTLPSSDKIADDEPLPKIHSLRFYQLGHRQYDAVT